eukprot:1252760-Rhodomonas_salina.2
MEHKGAGSDSAAAVVRRLPCTLQPAFAPSISSASDSEQKHHDVVMRHSCDCIILMSSWNPESGLLPTLFVLLSLIAHIVTQAAAHEFATLNHRTQSDTRNLHHSPLAKCAEITGIIA